MSAEHAEHAEISHPYYRVLVALTVLTILEIGWALPHFDMPRLLLIGGLSIMAAVKAALVALYYMHLKYETRVLWAVVCFPIVLVTVMILGLIWDAFGYW